MSMNSGSNKQDMGSMVGGLGISQSVVLSRPSKNRHVFLILSVVALVAITALAVFWYLGLSSAKLATKLPENTPWYLRIELPKDNWYMPLIFWNQQTLINSKVQSLFKELDIFYWDDNSFAEDILPILSDSIEVAQLANGEVIISSYLNNKDAWLNLVNISSEEYNGQIYEMNSKPMGLWDIFVQDRGSWWWYIEKDQLYIISSDSAKTEFSQNKEQTVSKLLESYSIEKSRGLILFNNSIESLYIENSYISALLESSDLPLVFDIHQSPENISINNISTGEKAVYDSLNSPVSGIEKIYQISDSDISLYSASIGSSYMSWFSSIIGISKTLESLESSINDIYDLNIKEIVDNSLNSELLVLVWPNTNKDLEENEWVVASTADILASLQDFGTRLFAQDHPKAIEQRLSDGSLMVELFADTEGIVWQDYNIEYSGVEYQLSSLQGQGEVEIYIVGEIEGLGAILTNSEVALEKIVEYHSVQNDLTLQFACKNSDLESSIRLKSDTLFGSNFVNDFFSNIVITNTKDGGTNSCIFFR